MTKEIAKKEIKSAMHQLAARLSVTPQVLQDTLKATAFKTCATNEQFVAAVMVANTYRLNPILKEMTVFPSKHGGVIPIVMIDGFISMVNRQKDFDGVDLVENEGEGGDSGTDIESVTATFYLKSKTHPVIVTEYMKECYNGSKDPWKKWPRRMLRHKAYIQGARIAFGFSGVYDPDEADRIIDIEALPVKGKPDVVEPKELPEKTDASPYKNMLDDFAKSKAMLGEKTYYAILKKHGFNKSNEIREVQMGNVILEEMVKTDPEQK